MAIQTEIDRINTSVQVAYAMLEGMGASMPEEQTIDNLGATVATIALAALPTWEGGSY